MNILGISAYYHDSAACLLKDGQVVAAAQEERFTRIKHDSSFPARAIAYCLAQLSPSEHIDYVAFYDNFNLKRQRSIINVLRFGAAASDTFRSSVGNWGKFNDFEKNIAEHVKPRMVAFENNRIFCVQHHMSHAASAYYCSNLPKAAVLTMDGVGEFETTTIGVGEGDELRLTHSINFPDSLGLFYSAITQYLGFKVNSGEYKVMGLAPLGEPVYLQKLLDDVVHLNEDGSFSLNLDYFSFYQRPEMSRHGKMEALLGFGPRQEESPLRQEDRNLAASAQAVIEKAVFGLMKQACQQAGTKDICLAGGVALNCSALGKMRNTGEFGTIFVQPAAGDAGGSLGAALYLHHHLPNRIAVPKEDFKIYLGPSVDTAKAKAAFLSKGLPFLECKNEQELCETVAKRLADGAYVGWCQGQMEWGPRALGNRSILASPMKENVQRDLNLTVKKRESFRPFAPVILEEFAPSLFKNPGKGPFMQYVFFLKDDLRPQDASFKFNGHEVSPAQARAIKSAAIHRDGSARIQTINEKENPRYYRLLKAFYHLTGCPVLINTSFNVRGEPMVCDYWDAYKCFWRAELDLLAVDTLLFERTKQPLDPNLELEAFELD